MTIGADPLLHALRSGTQAYQAGDLPAAMAAARQAVALAPDHPGARNLFGAALLGAGHATDAVIELERAAQLARNDAAILGNLGQAYAAVGRHDDAYQTFRKASRIEPRSLHYAQGAAIALAQQGKFTEAEPLLRRLTARFPDDPAPWFNLGNLYRDQQQLPAAEQGFRAALARDPGYSEAHNSLGSVLHAQLRFTEAEAEYRACIATRPDHVPAQLNLVSVLIDDGRFAAAEDACRALLTRAPELPEAHRFLATSLSKRGNSVAALPAYARAAALAPDDPDAQRSYGGALAEAGYMHKALRVLRHAARLAPDPERLQQLLSSLFLTQGIYADGWSAYRRRPAFLRFAEKLGPGTLVQELPADVTGKQITVLREQGLGDELFFLRYVPLLKARGARVTVRVSSRIAALVARSGCADTVVPDTAPATPADLQILCGDLPHALGTCAASDIDPAPDPARCRDFAMRISVFVPRLPATLRIAPLADAIAAIRERLRAAGNPPYLGVTWRAGTAASAQGAGAWALSKEVALPELAQRLRGFRGTLLALQRQPAEGEVAALAAHLGATVHDFSDLNDDLESMLALLELIDDYVGVSNTNMHLRAAAGRAARVLVPNPPEWRWLALGHASPWFPQFTVYRQSLRGDWSDALRTLARDLQQPSF